MSQFNNLTRLEATASKQRRHSSRPTQNSPTNRAQAPQGFPTLVGSKEETPFTWFRTQRDEETILFLNFSEKKTTKKFRLLMPKKC